MNTSPNLAGGTPEENRRSAPNAQGSAGQASPIRQTPPSVAPSQSTPSALPKQESPQPTTAASAPHIEQKPETPTQPTPGDAYVMPKPEPAVYQPKPASSVKTEPPLLPSASETFNFFTRGRVLAVIALIFLVSFYIDRLPAKAPNTNGSPSIEDLALIASNSGTGIQEESQAGTVTLYFNNGLLDQTMSCEKVFPVKRTAKDPSPEGALALLLAGPTKAEGNAGYFTAISPGVIVNKAGIENDVAIADLDTHLAWNVVPGSCREKAIRAQITETLKNFTGVKDAKILVAGSEKNMFAQ